jgi:hypothetical protein
MGMSQGQLCQKSVTIIPKIQYFLKLTIGILLMAYTDKMIALIEKAQPLNLEKAKVLASDMGVSYRSIISKAKQMGFEYVAKAPATKKAKSNEPTKAELLADIRSKLGLPERDGDLTKAEIAEISANLL